MNRFLHFFVLILLVNQYLSEDACEKTESTDACSVRTVTSSIYKCTQTSDEGATPITCTEEKKTCAEASALTDIDCSQLSTETILCITGASGCITPTKCEEVISDATESICQGFENTNNKCEFIAANTEGETNQKAHCKSVAKTCTDSLGDVSTGQEEICSNRPKTDGAICYFDGNSACKEASKCEDIVFSLGKTVPQTTCNTYNTDTTAQKKCVAEGNKCLLKSYCDDGTTAEHECSYYALKDLTKVCAPKINPNTECEEITQEEFENRQGSQTTTACKTDQSTTACADRTVTSSIYKCTQTSKEGPITCTEEKKTCAEASALTNIDCSQLSTEQSLCITGKSGCITPTTCDEVISDASATICQGFEDTNNKCEFIAANTAGETNQKAHCKSVAKTCTDSLGDVSTGQEEICTKRHKSDEAICYFDGNSACKEASKCEDIVYSLGKTVPQTTCNTYNTDTTAQKKCVAEDNKCVLKSYCDDGKTSEHECSYYELKTEGNVCVLKQDSTTECKEYSQADYQARLDEQANGFCQGKSEAECKLTFANTFFVKCELEGKECKSKLTYGTCSSAASLSEATNEQCSKLTHSSNTFCVKGISGCVEVESCEGITGTDALTDAICNNFPVLSFQECVKGTGACTLKTKKCTDQSIIYEEGICGLLETTSANQKCYYNGAKCSEATSCETITDTTLTGNSLKAVCAQFNTVTENCVPDGKKCKLVEKSESEEEEEEEKKENEGGKTSGSSLGKALTLSFAILILVLVL